MSEVLEEGAVSDAIQKLLQTHNMTVRQLADEIHVPEQTLYSMLKKSTNRADLGTLYSIAAYFDEEITIFLGPRLYKPRRRYSVTQEKILDMTDLMSDEGKDKVLTYAVDISNRYGGK